MEVKVHLDVDSLVAEVCDGTRCTTLRGTPEDLGRQLAALGVAPEQVTMLDWREGDRAPMNGQKIAFFQVMRRVR